MVVRYCDLRKIPIFHIPNGGKRNSKEAAHLKEQGVKPGVPDLCIPLACGIYHGLYIEMKADKNKTTDKQDEWLDLLSQNGYQTAVCWSFDEARAVIDKYISLKEGEQFAEM